MLKKSSNLVLLLPKSVQKVIYFFLVNNASKHRIYLPESYFFPQFFPRKINIKENISKLNKKYIYYISSGFH